MRVISNISTRRCNATNGNDGIVTSPGIMVTNIQTERNYAQPGFRLPMRVANVPSHRRLRHFCAEPSQTSIRHECYSTIEFLIANQCTLDRVPWSPKLRHSLKDQPQRQAASGPPAASRRLSLRYRPASISRQARKSSRYCARSALARFEYRRCSN